MSDGPSCTYVALWKGQRYVKIGERGVVTLAGRFYVADVWRSHCAECGMPFESTTLEYDPKTGLSCLGGSFIRRCEKHRSFRKVR